MQWTRRGNGVRKENGNNESGQTSGIPVRRRP